MHEDIAQGIVWLPRDGRPARCIVKITNPRSGKSIFVERLEFDENFRKRYNQRRLPRSIEHVDSAAIVINQWYRSTLCIETNHKYPLGIHTPNRWWGNLRAILQHPQVAVRISCWLGILGVVLGLLSLALSLPTAIGKVAFPRRSPQIVQLSAQDVLDRRTSYEELLGKTRQELVQKLGTPQKETESSPYWNSSPQTQGRGIRIGIAMLTDPDKSRQESFVKTRRRFSRRRQCSRSRQGNTRSGVFT